MKLDKFILGLLAFSFMVVASLFVFVDMQTEYNVSVSGEYFNDTYNKIDDTYNLSQDIQDDVLNAEIEGADQSWDSMVKSSYSAVRLIGRTFSLVGTMVESVVNAVGIPGWIIKFIMTAVAVMVIFAIIYLLFRVN